MWFITIILPFIGTTLGAMLAFFLGNKINKKIEKILLGLSAGVMVAASIWSLLIPSIENSSHLKILSFLPATIGFVCGILLFVFLFYFEIKTERTKNDSISRLILAVTLHNIPEGMAVGVALAGALSQDYSLSMSSAITLSIGIAIQNIPEGAIISMPLRASGEGKFKSFLKGVLSGIVEPIASFLTILLINIINPLLPYLLSFAAGAMIYVVVDELIPESQDKRSLIGTIAFTIGFLIMMILDVMLG